MGSLTEAVKNFFKKPTFASVKDSNIVPIELVQNDLSHSEYNFRAGAFFDDGIVQADRAGTFGQSELEVLLKKQYEKIQTYRTLSRQTEVANAINEIVSECVFSYDDTVPLTLVNNEENEKIRDSVQDCFDKLMDLIDVRKNIYDIVRRSYIDGQLVFAGQYYDEQNYKKGFKSIKLIDPCYFYYDAKENIFKYYENFHNGMVSYSYYSPIVAQKMKYSREEIVRENFGLFDNGLCLSYLDDAIKVSNILTTLEDLLVPLRFSRSISRRVFNVDIGDLPTKRGVELLRQYQDKFKYKKFYNAETGEVTNQQHITSMVEDYWFANRSGGKGTTVDTIDETGNLGELNDILYYCKKLYRALHVPTNRIDINPDQQPDYSYQADTVNLEDFRFYVFITRVRNMFSTAFKELLKRQVVSTGVMNEAQWDEREKDIKIQFTNENTFIEKLKLDTFVQKLNIYHEVKEDTGKIFPVKNIMQNIFRMTEDEIEHNFKAIEDEKKDKIFKNFYSDPYGEEDADGDYTIRGKDTSSDNDDTDDTDVDDETDSEETIEKKETKTVEEPEESPETE